MALNINTNIGALGAAAAASAVNKSMETAMERLSTGLRVNTAADDAAGIAIGSRLTSEIRGTNQAIRNAMDGQAMIDTAEGAHNEIVNILQRMRELAVQSANDTNSAQDRANLDAEIQQLVSEIDRIADVTTWAGQSLLDGSKSGGFALQVGTHTNAADSLAVTINSVTSAALGLDGSGSTASASSSLTGTSFASTFDGTTDAITITAAATGQAAVAGQDATAAVSEAQTFTITAANDTYYKLKDAAGNTIADYTSDSSATLAEIAAGLTAGTDGDGATVTVSTDGTDLILNWSDSANKGLVTLEAGGGAIDSATGSTSETVTVDISAGVGYSATATNGYELSITTSDGSTVNLTAPSGSAYATVAALVDAFQGGANATAYQGAAFTLSDNGTDIVVTFNDVDGPSDVSLRMLPTTTTTATASIDGTAAQAAVTAQDAVSVETITVAMGSQNFEVELDTSTYATSAAQATQIASVLNSNSTFSAQFTATANNGTISFTGLADTTFNVTTAANSTAAINTIDAAISTINTQRANLGAISNRLDSTVNNLTNIATNLEAGRSRILDADFAAESTNLAKSQILQQASMAMLAQANASKQGVLSLLQG